MIGVLGSTQGYYQWRQIVSVATDTLTVDAWDVTPTGTITYVVLAAPPASASAPPGVNVVQISGDGPAADNLEAAADGTGYNLGGGSVVAASVAGAVGSVTGAVGSVAGAVASVTGAAAKKNTALAKFSFVMRDSTNHAPATGKTVTCTRSIDGAAFAAGTLANVAELSNGVYLVDFGTGDLNGTVITLRATATDCDDLFVTILTTP